MKNADIIKTWPVCPEYRRQMNPKQCMKCKHKTSVKWVDGKWVCKYKTKGVKAIEKKIDKMDVQQSELDFDETT